MNDANNKELLVDPNVNETIAEREKRIELQHKKDLDAKDREIRSILEIKDEKGREAKKERDKNIGLEAANKALDKALWEERNQKDAGIHQSQTEGEIISHMAYNVLMSRCKAGRYGVKCDKH